MVAPRPRVSGESQKELDKIDSQFETKEQEMKSLTMDELNLAPKEDVEPQTKIAQVDLDKLKDVYLKPNKSIACQDKFNEKFRSSYEFDKQYVQFIAEHKELIGEKIEIWTRPYGGMRAEFWQVPTNKPVWGPRYLAEQIKRKSYHRLVMQESKITGQDGTGQYYGAMVADTSIPRLDARPVSNRKSIFMGANNFA